MPLVYVAEVLGSQGTYSTGHPTAAVMIFVKVQQYFHLQVAHITLSVALEVSAGCLLTLQKD